VILPYVLLVENINNISLEPINILMLVLVGIIHTGIAYTLYFGSMSNVKAQTVAIFGYIDPVVAIILSALILRERMGMLEIIGAVLILGATLVCEIDFKKKTR
jgi:drug/metabolite transporter (DMT)-like permease